MPFRLGKGDKKDEQPQEEAAATEREAEDSLDPAAEAAAVDPDRADTSPGEGAPPEEPEQGGGQPFTPPDFRPSFLNGDRDAAPTPPAGSGGPASEPSPAHEPTERLIFVVIRDEEGQAVSLQQFEEARDARAHVELSVESGTPEEHVAVFRGDRVPVQVVRRPVVRLVPKED